MKQPTRKPYQRPELQAHGSVAELTKFFNLFGVEGFLKLPTRGRGPADFGS